MPDQSQLLNTAEKVVLLFHEVIENVTGDQLEAAKALLKMTVAVNELAIEVNKGKELLSQLEKLKADITGQTEQAIKETAEAITEEKTQPQTQTDKPAQPAVDPSKLLETIFSSMNIPQNIIPPTKKPGQ
jgi:hypothetical protein